MMFDVPQSRRHFFVTSGAVAGGCLGAARLPAQTPDEKPRAKVERLGVGAIGMRYQGSGDHREGPPVRRHRRDL